MADDNILASNLAQLGGQIAATFQNVALQNQYKNSLPAMQQIFKQSMTDFDSGRSGAGFARIMDVAMQNPNNPYIQNMAQMAFKAGQLASDDYFKRQQIDISRQKATSKGATIIPENFFGDGTNTEGTTVGVPNTNEVIVKNNSLTPEEQANIAKNATISSDQVGQLKQGQQVKDAAFLRYYGIDADAIIGPAIFTQEQRDSLTKTLSSKGASISQTRKYVKQNEDIAKAFDSDFSALVQADKLLKSDSTTQDLLNQSNNNIFNIKVTQVPSATGGRDKIYEAYVGNNKKVDITEDQYKAIIAIKGAAAGVKAYGGNLVSSQSSKERFPVREQVQTQQAEQPVVAPAQPATQVSESSKPTEFSNQQNPFFEAAQRSQVSSAPKGGGRAGRTGEGRAKQIQAEIDSIDERIKTIEKRRGSPQDKYRAFERLSEERKKLQSELSKFSK